MVKMKAGGIVLGGIAAYLILSKGIGAVERGIRNICVAHEWKNYYKYGKEGNMVPPGYQMHTHTTENGDNVQVGTPEAIKQEENKQKGDTSQKPLGATIGEAIAKVINEVFTTDKKAEEASEGPGEPCKEYYDKDKNDNEDDAPTLDFSENPDGEFVDKEGNKV